MNSKELKEFRWTVEEYIAKGKENAISGEWIKQLENASARIHISRLESLKINLQNQCEVLLGNQVDGLDKTLTSIYKDSYYRTAYEVQRGLNVGYDFHKLNETEVKAVISKPWTADGSNFSNRCWTAKKQLVDTLHTELTQAIIRGDAPDKAIENIARKFDTSRKNAGRLVMTESAFFSSTAQQDCFNELDIEKYEIVATLDMKTSSICRNLDGKVFKMSDFRPGVTAPPFHCYCRSCTAPYFEDDEGYRAARNQDGKTYYIPSDIKYAKWYNKYVNSDIKSKLEKSLVGINTSNGVEIKIITDHVVDRAIQRNVAVDEIKEALVNPLKVCTIRDDDSQKFIGEKATVSINVKTGKVIQTNPTSSKLARRLKE